MMLLNSNDPSNLRQPTALAPDAHTLIRGIRRTHCAWHAPTRQMYVGRELIW